MMTSVLLGALKTLPAPLHGRSPVAERETVRLQDYKNSVILSVLLLSYVSLTIKL